MQQVTSAPRLPRASVQSCHLSPRRGRGASRSERKGPPCTFGTQSDGTLFTCVCDYVRSQPAPENQMFSAGEGREKRCEDKACTHVHCTPFDFRNGGWFTMEMEPQHNQICAGRPHAGTEDLKPDWKTGIQNSQEDLWLSFQCLKSSSPRLWVNTSKTNTNQSSPETKINLGIKKGNKTCLARTPSHVSFTLEVPTLH